MFAVVCHSTGSLDNLKIEQVAQPEPGPHQVLVEVGACSVNFPDVLTVLGQYQYQPEPPFTPGSEVAGVVTAVGEKVSPEWMGKEVVAAVTGGLAQYVVAPAASLVQIPDGVSMAEASAFLYAYGTAYYALTLRGHIQPDEHLLVLGAAGGVGLATVELGRVLGAKVIAAASSDEKLQACREAGAEHTINYATADLRAELKKITPRGPEVIVDPVGGAMSEAALRSIAWNGSYLVVGFAAGQIPTVPWNLMLLKGANVKGVFWGGHLHQNPAEITANLNEVVDLWRDGQLVPHVSQVYPFDQAPEALEQLYSRKAVGKIVVEIAQ